MSITSHVVTAGVSFAMGAIIAYATLWAKRTQKPSLPPTPPDPKSIEVLDQLLSQYNKARVALYQLYIYGNNSNPETDEKVRMMLDALIAYHVEHEHYPGTAVYKKGIDLLNECWIRYIQFQSEPTNPAKNSLYERGIFLLDQAIPKMYKEMVEEYQQCCGKRGEESYVGS